MHEWALADAVARYVLELLKENNASRLEKIIIRLGVLQSIDKEVFMFSLRELFRQYNIEYSDEAIVLVDEEALFRCRRCGYTWSLNDLEIDEAVMEAIHFIPEVVHSYFTCPRCGSRDFEVVKGRGLTIGEVVVK